MKITNFTFEKEEKIEKALDGLEKDNLIILKKNIIEINSN